MFFDFHIHPTLKSMFSTPDAKTSPWVKLDVKKIPWILRWCTEFEYILGSQANLEMISRARAVFICVALYVPEKAMTQSKLVLEQSRGTLQPYLNPVRLEKINSGELKPFPDLMMEDLDVLLKPEKFNVTTKKIIPLTKENPYNENAPSTIYVAFTIEGAHSLSSTLDKTKMNPDDVIANLDILRKNVPVISMNLTHLEQYPLANHAYGIQFVATEDFKPTGNRISNKGLSVLKHCYQHKILIDVKHLSLAARQQLYGEIRASEEIGPIKQPLVCTHAGFTGIAYKDIPDYIDLYHEKTKEYSYIILGKPKKYRMLNFELAFNPTSINLYDEEILEIVKSGGIIGLSMDKRILGYTEATNRSPNVNELAFEKEYISNLEKEVYLTKRRLGEKVNSYYCITSQEVLQGGVVLPALGYYHLCHFMQHILHYFRVILADGYPFHEALKQICIGSDFDGIINPLSCCETILDYADLKKQFIKSFVSFAKANKNSVQLPKTFDVKAFAEMFFYENGKNFVLKRLEEIHSQ